MLEDLYENNSNSYEVMKRTAEDRSAWRESITHDLSVTYPTSEYYTTNHLFLLVYPTKTHSWSAR